MLGLRYFILLLLSSGVSFAVYDFTTIDVSGFYKLAANVDSQITISVSNVTLDLNGHTVTGAATGIAINSNLSNITIKNGTARCTQASSEAIDVGTGCSDIAIENVTAKQARIGVVLDEVVNSTIKNCNFDLNDRGINISSCANILVENCIATSNKRYAYDLNTSTTCTFLNCKAISTGDRNTTADGAAAEAFGFITNDGYGNLFENCIANSTQNLNATDWETYVAGFALRGTESCTKIIGCEAGNSTSNGGGNTVPYGIWLEGTFDSLVSVTVVEKTNFAAVNGRWSPDGKYAAIGGVFGTDDFLIYSFDPVTKILTRVAGNESTQISTGVAWHPGGEFIASVDEGTELIIYRFDRINNSLQEVAVATSVDYRRCDWRFDGRFIACVDEPGHDLVAYEFDRVSLELTLLNSYDYGADLRDVKWSPDGKYIVIVGERSGSISVEVMAFDETTKTILSTPVDSIAGARFNTAVSWSYDGRYIAVGSEVDGGANTRIFSFIDETLTLVATADSSFGDTRDMDIDWSPDGRFLAIAGVQNRFGVATYFFDRDDETLNLIDSFTFGNELQISQWSPDGTTLLFGGGVAVPILLYEGITFPEKNVIMNNKLYCNSGAIGPQGVGISGSSIKNMIIQNCAYDNPYNYQMVQNVFDQNFGNGPTLLQNKQFTADDPICTPMDIEAQMRRVNLLLTSLVDNLL